MKRLLCVFFLLAITLQGFTQSITSTFNSGTDGWTAPSAATSSFTWVSSGGNPGGYVRATDPVTAAAPSYWTFNSPAAYTGNLSAYYNGTLQFDLQQGASRTPVANVDVTLQSSSFVLSYTASPAVYPAVAPGWTTYKIELNELSGLWKDGTGANATAAQFTSLLTTTTIITIRGRYGNSPLTTGGLDNVLLQQFYVSTQPTGQTVCDGTVVSLNSVGTGLGTITYHWQKFNSITGGWNDVSNGGGYSNATTATLNINTTGNFGAGTYRARISRVGANDIFSNGVAVAINPTPSAPGVTPNSSCGPAALALGASGGAAGQYRWYSVATGGTAIAGQTAATYTTPVLSSTTTYYVAINNGTCESARTPVAATINPVPVTPTPISNFSCGPGTVTLAASGGSNGQYRWYTVPTGGSPIAGQTNATYVTPNLTATTSYYVSINNGLCEGSRATVTASIITCPPNDPPVIATTTANTVIGGVATLSLPSLISDPNNNLNLASLQIKKQPSSGATASIDASYNLMVDYTGLSFAGKDQLTLEVCDALNSCAEQDISIDVSGDITIYNAISPNSDGKNDVWTILNIELLTDTKSNHVSIFDRWGSVVFETENYDNKSSLFKGVGKGGSDLPAGTYFYKIEFASGRPTLTGYLALRR